MLERDRIDTCDGIDVNKTKVSCRSIICYYYYLLGVNFRSQLGVCNGCHKIMLKTVSTNDVAIVSVNGNDNEFLFWYMSIDEAINLVRNVGLSEKWSIVKHKDFLLYIKYG